MNILSKLYITHFLYIATTICSVKQHIQWLYWENSRYGICLYVHACIHEQADSPT